MDYRTFVNGILKNEIRHEYDFPSIALSKLQFLLLGRVRIFELIRNSLKLFL